jgi:hypothetical protein
MSVVPVAAENDFERSKDETLKITEETIDQLQAVKIGIAQKTVLEPKTTPKPKTGYAAKVVNAGEFEAEKHFYPRVLNANIHPLVSSFFALGNKLILARYTHLNPQISAKVLESLLSYKPKYFQWAGTR